MGALFIGFALIAFIVGLIIYGWHKLTGWIKRNVHHA